MYSSTCFFSSTLFIKRHNCFTTGKLNSINFTATTYLNLHMLAERINTGYTYAMQTSGNLVASVTKLAAGMQDSHNYFYSRLANFMHFYRNTTTIITYSNAIIAMNSHIDSIAITC